MLNSHGRFEVGIYPRGPRVLYLPKDKERRIGKLSNCKVKIDQKAY
jgi:hypothetical protein